MHSASGGSMEPTVSIVMPVWNAAAYLSETLASLRAQAFTGWELIAVDDGSTDDSLAILRAAAAGDPRISVVETGCNRGPGPARNLGMTAARGRYVAFVDADDLWHPKKLLLQLEALRDSGAIIGCTAYSRKDFATSRERVLGVPARIDRRMLLNTNYIGCSTALFDRAAVGARHMPEMRLRQDFAFWLALLEDGGFAAGLPLALVTCRETATSASASKMRAARATWAMYRRHLGLPLQRALWHFANYALRGFVRHRLPALGRRLGWLHGVRDLPQE